VSTSMVATYGGLQAVEYFKALDDGRFDKNCKKQRKCARKNLQLMHDFSAHSLDLPPRLILTSVSR
jgi:hypothetical protein